MMRAAFNLTQSMLVLFLITASAAVSASAAELTFDFKIERGRVAENMRLIRVTQGDVVTLQWTSDERLVLHLHGYDIEKRVVPGTVVDMTFSAYATGRFPIHVHTQATGGRPHEEAPLVNVEVYPR
jgi:plastocyanin